MPTTTNHVWNLPIVGADADEWGTELNAAFQDVDTLTSGAQNTVLGRVAASSGPYTQLTATQLTTIPNAVVGDSGSGGTKGLVPAPAAGDAAAKKVLQADGTWGNEIKAWAKITGTTVTAGRNIASATNPGLGVFNVVFTTAMANTDYAVFVTANDAAFGQAGTLATGNANVVFYDSTGTGVNVASFNVFVMAA